jgi:hypothetical protein
MEWVQDDGSSLSKWVSAMIAFAVLLVVVMFVLMITE